jgi:MFS transporter, OCT family, solute carrier family 22 (organic cation transporter), member 4/5
MSFLTRSPEPNLLSLFRTRLLLRYTLGMYLLWFGHGFVYYGIALNIGDIGGDLFDTFFLFGLVDVPAFILCSFTLAAFRRKVLLGPIMAATSVCLLATMAFDKGQYWKDWPIVTLAMSAKFGLSITFTSLYS